MVCEPQYGQQDDQTGCDADCARQYALHSAPARILAFFLLLLGDLALKQQVGVTGDFFNFRIFLRRADQSDHMKYGNAGRKAAAGTGVWSAIMQ